MRTTEQILKSLINSYNNNERPNYIDLIDLQNKMRTTKQILKSLINSYNNNERPNFIDLRDLETILNLQNNE